ncbi:hypothetical protein L1887_06735 [Cichorium endivia]|nr:hypothetical protein L1887_06735 [Cichorium endivia]
MQNVIVRIRSLNDLDDLIRLRHYGLVKTLQEKDIVDEFREGQEGGGEFQTGERISSMEDDWYRLCDLHLKGNKTLTLLLLDTQMQTPKASTKTSPVGSRKISPRSNSSDTTQRNSGRIARQLKTTGLESNSSSPNQPIIRTPKSTSPVIVARRSPRSPISEKKRPGRVTELEAEISQLQDALKTVKDQLVSSESWKNQAKLDAEESKKQLLSMSSRLEESQKLLARFSSEEPHGVQELENIDEKWIPKIEEAKKLHSADLDSLAVAINEINQLKRKLDGKADSEVTQNKQAESAIAELRTLKETVAKTLSVVETLKTELKDCKISEFQAQELARESLLQLETAKMTIMSLEFDRSKEQESENPDEEKIKDSKFEEESENPDEEKIKDSKFEEESENPDEEKIKDSKFEEESENPDEEKIKDSKFEEESRKRMEIARVKLSELEDELKKSKVDIEELKANLMDKETELQGICEENEELNLKLKNSRSGIRENEIKNLKQDFDFLKSKMAVMETELKVKSDENEKMKLEIKKRECKDSLGGSESELVLKIDYLVEEVEKSNRKVARVAAELEAAQAVNGEMEADLRKMKVQSEQWRKAAEAAAAMVSTGNNVGRKLVVRTGSMDNYTPGMNVDDDDDELLKKKNGSVLKRIGVLWKKPQNKRP